jgi:hypothetical protein
MSVNNVNSRAADRSRLSEGDPMCSRCVCAPLSSSNFGSSPQCLNASPSHNIVNVAFFYREITPFIFGNKKKMQ